MQNAYKKVEENCEYDIGEADRAYTYMLRNDKKYHFFRILSTEPGLSPEISALLSLKLSGVKKVVFFIQREIRPCLIKSVYISKLP